jgi:hypothetical protein
MICRRCGQRRSGDGEGAAQASGEQKLIASGGDAILRMGVGSKELIVGGRAGACAEAELRTDRGGLIAG